MLKRIVFTVFAFWLFAAGETLAETKIHIATPGAPEELKDELRAASLVRSTGRDAPAQDLFAAAQAEYAQLLGVLYERGYYGGVITVRIDGREAASIPPLNPPSRIELIQIQVRSGPLYRFSDARITPLAPGTELPEGFTTGSGAGSGTIREAAQASVDGWRALGYAKAEIDQQQIVAQHNSDTVATRIAVSPGPKLRFGEVTVSGKSKVSTRRIRKIAGVSEGLEEGRTFSPEEVEKSANRLRRTGSFRSVNIVEDPGVGPDNTQELTIEVVDATPRRFGFGGEYSTDEGTRITGYWLHRNLLGGAERFRVDGSISGIGGEYGDPDYNFGVRYERPATPKADVDLYAELTFEGENEPDYTSDSIEFSLGFTRYATETLTVEYGLGYLYSDSTDAFGRDVYHLLTLPLAAELDRRNDKLDATSGFYVDLELTPYAGLKESADGGLLELDSRLYGGPEGLTFAGRMQLGALFSPSLEESPTVYRFYSGGGGTVRGQSYESLGVDVGGERVGGRSFLGLSGEVRGDVTENIQLVGFYDWGYIGAETFPDFTGDSHSGAGIGVRYKTGIGPIRLDLATPVSGDTDSSDFYIYVGIGQAF